MRSCPSCAATFGDDVDVCPDDGTALEPVEEASPADEADDVATSGALLTTLHAGDTGPVTGPAPKAEPESADDEELAPGTLLAGVYEVVRKVGQGGMGAVYEVEHKRMQKRYAAKVLRREVSANKEYVQRLEREAVAATRIEHPNIVRVVNLDETDDGQVFLIMEYLEGEDLSHLLGEGRLSPAAVLTIGIQVATALHKVHERGIVHRDLKPENIFLAKEEEETVVKLLDFGISKLDTPEGDVRLTKTGCVMGTPLYMSPEHARGEASLDRRADIYSLGVILYEALVGGPPFDGTQTIEVMLKHVSEVPRPPSSVEGSLPEPLDELVLKALEKEPAARYQTLADFAAAMAETGERIGISRSELPEIGPGRSRSLESLTPGPVALTASGAAAKVSPFRGRVAAIAAISLVAVAAAVVFLVLDTGTSPAPPASMAPGRAPAPAGAAPMVAPAPVPSEPRAGAPVAPSAESANAEPAPPQPPPQPPEPRVVAIMLRSEPTGADVFLGEEKLGVTPLEHEHPFGQAPIELTFRKRGHKPAVERVTPDQKQAIQVRLVPRKKRQRQKTPKKSVFRGDR